MHVVPFYTTALNILLFIVILKLCLFPRLESSFSLILLIALSCYSGFFLFCFVFASSKLMLHNWHDLRLSDSLGTDLVPYQGFQLRASHDQYVPYAHTVVSTHLFLLATIRLMNTSLWISRVFRKLFRLSPQRISNSVTVFKGKLIVLLRHFLPFPIPQYCKCSVNFSVFQQVFS